MEPIYEDDELDLRHYLEVVKRRKWVIVAATLLVTLVAVLLSVRQTPQYRASVTMLLRGNEAEQRLDPGQIDNTDRNRVDTEIGVIESELVREAVEEVLGREDPSMSVSANGDTDLITMSSTSPVPEIAAETANTYAEVYVQWKRESAVSALLDAQSTVQNEIDNLQSQLDDLLEPIEELRGRQFNASPAERDFLQGQINDLEDEISAERNAINQQIALYQQQISQLQVSQNITTTGGAQIVSRASVPEDPFEPQPVRNGVLGVVVGLMLGIGLAFLFETLDDRIRSKEDLERATGWSAIGLIPAHDALTRRKGTDHDDLVTVVEPRSVVAEAFHALRTAVQFLGLERPLEVIQVTSPRAADGKTTTAANLAVTLARAGKRVVLIDADLRRPRLHQVFGIENDKGFTTVLLGTAASAETFHASEIDNLMVMPAGPPPPNPSELLALPRTRQMIERLRGQCDIVVIDSPPVLPVTDPLVISGFVDGVIVVTDAKRARSRELGRVAELLRQVNATVLGAVVNRVGNDEGYGYEYDYRYEYTSYDSEPSALAPLSSDDDETAPQWTT